MLHDMLRRILRNMDLSENEIDESIYDAMLLSVDVAHALHPNKKEKMDITNKPVMGKGFCIKQACSQSYATDAQALAILCQLCDEKGIPYQRFVNRSDSVAAAHWLDCRHAFAGKDCGYRYTYSCNALSL